MVFLERRKICCQFFVTPRKKVVKCHDVHWTQTLDHYNSLYIFITPDKYNLKGRKMLPWIIKKMNSNFNIHSCAKKDITFRFQYINGSFPEGRNEGGRVATPTSFSMFDSSDMKNLWFKFGPDIFNGFKIASL